MQRGNRAASDITQQTGNTNVVVRKLDLSSFDSVRQFAEGVLDTEPRIHILVNNAAWVGQFAQTDEGIEMQWQVNHLSHFLLTNLLLERMKASSPSRIVNVSSRAHAWAKSLDMEAIRTETAATHNKYIAYARSKLANVLFTRELSRRLKGTGVTVNALHPGGVQTELGRRMPKLMRFIMIVLLFPILLLFVKTSRQGAQTSIYLAVSEEVDGVTGHYFSDCAVKDASAMARDDDLARRLWEHSASMTAL
ncbi:PREDICTED: retinol dehydrogenase 11-like [Priapulus caudatus]|uniref:Retinol dehydrogenase 11-like n=1 Tax=Priapulus caudatus TaxID=37621 RepID=A0ABM1EV48_PRICU|nr:PREDICTED: retinol dehydrogenase 11-like [Priapulus caudatus]